LFSFVRDERREYDAEAQRDRATKTNALRAENEKLATEIADRKKTAVKTPRLSFVLAPGLIWQEVDDAIARGLRLGDVGHRAFALLHDVEVVERESKLAKKGELPRADRKGVREVRFNVRLRVSPLVNEQVTLARQRIAAELGRNVTDEEFTGALVDLFLRKLPDGMQSYDSLYRVILDMRPADGTATVRTDDGPVPIDAAMA